MILQENATSNSAGPGLCEIEVRADGIVSSANSWYYKFVGSNSSVPFYELVADEDKEAIQADIVRLANASDDSIRSEYLTTLANLSDKITRKMHVALSHSSLTYEGQGLCHITLIDFKSQLDFAQNYQNILAKYRYFMTLKNEIYFDYFKATDFISIYKYVNERSIPVFKGPLNDWIATQRESFGAAYIGVEQVVQELVTLLREGAKSYDRTITLPDAESGAEVTVRIMGGAPLFSSENFFGIFVPNPIADHLPYYLTPAGRDPGTGLFNKRAATEYTMDMISAQPKNGWLLVIDIDDFKNINDTQGHKYGDDVIKAVADTISTTIGVYGITGRYGGDEFIVFIDEDLTREDVKDLLKVITKKLYLRFDPLVHVTLSIGICHYPDYGTSFDELFTKADQCLYIAKNKGKNRHIIYDPKLHDQIIRSGGTSVKSLTYIISKEQRRDFLVHIIRDLNEKGLPALGSSTDALHTLRELFDLDGVFGCMLTSDKPLFQEGNYVGELTDFRNSLRSPDFRNMTDNYMINVINDVEKMKELDHASYEIMKAHEIASSLQFIGIKDGQPECVICFDVFNRKRKWSDADIDSLSMLASEIAAIILE